MSELGGKLRTIFADVQAKRSGYEKLWLQDLRQYKGLYDPEIKAKMDAKRSQAFIRETRTKVRTLDARVMDLLFPANGEKNWGIKPSPNPEFPPAVEQELMNGLQLAKDTKVKEMLLQQVEVAKSQGQQVQVPANIPSVPVTPEELKLARLEAAKQIANKMSDEMQDQLTEVKYRNIIRNTVHSGHLYGTGFLKGPLVNKQRRNVWKQQPVEGVEGKFKWLLMQIEEDKPYIEFKHIWSIYPDLSVTELEDCRFLFERHVMPKHKVMELARRDDFDAELITQYIETHQNGDSMKVQFETELYNLKSFDTSPIDLQKNHYEVLEYWGFIDGADFIRAAAADDPDALALVAQIEIEGTESKIAAMDIFVNLWMIGNEVIKVAMQPIEGVGIPYYAYYFDKDETGIFAEGVATIMRDPQKLVNASVRAMIDNASHCAGPQYEVNTDLLDPQEDATDIGAFKVWLRTGKDADVAGKEVVRIKQISSYTPEFMQMWGAFSKSGDEVTIIPRYMQGDSRVSGAGRTAAGLSMLMGQANVGLSDLVKMFDDGITKPFITALYNWNMQFNPKEDIKGDLVIEAKGSTALMAKEVRSQQIQMFLQMTLNPYDAPWTKRNNLLAEWAKCTDIAEVDAVRTEEEYNLIMANQQEATKQQQAEAFNMELQKMQVEAQLKAEQGAGELELVEKAIRDISTRMRRLEQNVLGNTPGPTGTRSLPLEGGAMQ
jgi:hypothetical protein